MEYLNTINSSRGSISSVWLYGGQPAYKKLQFEIGNHAVIVNIFPLLVYQLNSDMFSRILEVRSFDQSVIEKTASAMSVKEKAEQAVRRGREKDLLRYKFGAFSTTSLPCGVFKKIKGIIFSTELFCILNLCRYRFIGKNLIFRPVWLISWVYRKIRLCRCIHNFAWVLKRVRLNFSYGPLAWKIPYCFLLEYTMH